MIINEINVAITKGGIAAYKLWSLEKYMVKKIKIGANSEINLIVGLFIFKWNI